MDLEVEFLSKITSFLPLKFECAKHVFPIPSKEEWEEIMFFVVKVKLALTLQATLTKS